MAAKLEDCNNFYPTSTTFASFGSWEGTFDEDADEAQEDLLGSSTRQSSKNAAPEEGHVPMPSGILNLTSSTQSAHKEGADSHECERQEPERADEFSRSTSCTQVQDATYHRQDNNGWMEVSEGTTSQSEISSWLSRDVRWAQQDSWNIPASQHDITSQAVQLQLYSLSPLERAAMEEVKYQDMIDAWNNVQTNPAVAFGLSLFSLDDEVHRAGWRSW
eukprot:TRINITY_DN22907_c0_g1_i1.p1 TRINITY_DN22907_c0_g1~~TRINITY_DN22907_c0_g1_i1.p1  ORF type:complete len:237 (+),score=30.85 TRINITY_DN22907_c0_g1_i1:59-712(+)